MTIRVLVVDDEEYLAEAVGTALTRAGMDVSLAFDGQEALDKVFELAPDVVVLDRDLPVVHGDAVCQEIVDTHLATRVIMLTASGTLDARLEGFSLGADDYLPKPFELPELIARIEALARRNAPQRGEVYRCGDVRLDTFRKQVTRGSRNARTTASLLSLAELEGGAKIAAEPVDLSALCTAVAQEHGIPADIAENVNVTGDRDLVRHAVDNLARNAVQHGAAGTAALRLRAAGDGGAALTVTNGGAVLDPAEVATLTEPFARARQRGHSKGGHGLGVALVRAIAAAHGGSLALEARPQGGVTATLHL